MDFQCFLRTSSTGAFGTNLKNDLYHQAFITRVKHAELYVRALDGLRKDLKIQVLEVLVQIQPPTWPKKGLVLW